MWTCWRSTSFIREAVDLDIELITNTNATVVVHDIRASTPVAARLLGIRLGVITHSPTLPGFSYPKFGTLELWTDTCAAFNKALAYYSQRPITDLRQLFAEGTIIIPSSPAIDPLPRRSYTQRVSYVGSLGGGDSDEYAGSPPLERSREESAEGLFFYRTVSSNAEVSEFAGAFQDIANNVIIATGSADSADSLRTALAGTDFRIAPLWPMADVRRQAGVAIHHGGPGSVVGCIEAGMPSLVLPGDSPERGIYGDRVEALGAGVTLSNGPNLQTDWHGAVDQSAPPVPWRTIRDQLDELVMSHDIRRGVDAAQKQLANLNVDHALDQLHVDKH